MFDITSFILGLQKGKSMGGGAVETDILPLQDASFAQNANTPSLYEWYLSPAPNVLTVGETYHIVWGKDEYICKAVDASAMMAGAVGMGNLGIYGGEDTGEPFVFAYLPAVGEGVEYDTLGCLTLETDETHSVRIYQGADANDVALLEDVPIELDLSNGNQTVSVPEGYAVKSAIITKPETLIPENIANGVTIAGVEGTLVSGGSGESGGSNTSNWKFVSGTTKGTGATLTIAHNLGKIPDIIYVTAKPVSSDTKFYIGGIGFSNAMTEALGGDGASSKRGVQYACLGNNMVSTLTLQEGVEGAHSNFSGMFGHIRNANANTFQVGGGSTAPLVSGREVTWWAVSGITG